MRQKIKKNFCNSEFEKELIVAGYRFIAGVDEVGRGALAGPVLAAAVILDMENLPEGINDSKKLTKKQRERLSTEILESALSTSVSFIEPQEIDRVNIHKAALFAMAEAIESLKIKPDFLLIDGFSLPSTVLPQKAIIKGDESVVSIAAASIIAKVERDRIMTDYDKMFPGYGFNRNVGYGTAEHLNALQKLGATQIHRRSFKGVTSQ